MSLEQALAANTAALLALTAAMSGTNAKTETTQPEATQPDAKAEKPKAEKPKAEKPAAEAKAGTSPGTTAEELTKAITDAVPVVGKEAVIGMLQASFGAARGRDITDPATRAKAIAALAALVEAADVD